MRIKIRLTGIVFLFLPLNFFAQYYKDLIQDITQVPTSMNNGVSSIEAAFNNARTNENVQLGTNMPLLTFPSNWASLGIQERASWLINKERVDRGLMAFTRSDTAVLSVAQYYANYLLVNNKFGHYEDGLTPENRLNLSPKIAACREFNYATENLAATLSNVEADILYGVEAGIYGWLYNDYGWAWGHRRCVLQSSMNDNSGLPNEEGLFAIGVVSGGPYRGSYSQLWSYAKIVVLEVIDPCALWIYDQVTNTTEIQRVPEFAIHCYGNQLQVLMPPSTNNATIQIYDILGAKVYDRKEENPNSILNLTVSLRQGLYIARLIVENKCYCNKLFIEN